MAKKLQAAPITSTSNPASTTTDAAENPRAVIGGNMPPAPTPVEIQADLRGRFAQMLDGIKTQAEACKILTAPINDDVELTAASDAFKSLRGERTKWEGVRSAEKEPFLAAERAVDGYFVPVRDRIDEILRALEAECGAYLRRKEAIERERRVAEARLLRLEEERKRREADDLRRAEEQRRQQASEKTTKRGADKAQVEADTLGTAAAIAGASADATASMADNAEAAAAAKPADLARTRGEGSLSTLAEKWEFELQDVDAIPLDLLRPYLKRDAIEAAVRAFVKINKGSKPLAGVRIFQDRKVNIR